MNKPSSPCKGCEDHNARCKFECERWQEYEKAKAEYNEAYQKYVQLEHDTSGIAIRRAYEQRRKYKRK